MSAPSLEDRSAIERLLSEYAFRLDAGEFDAFADLFADGVWLGHEGRDAVLAWVRANLYLYGEVPLTQHAVTNVVIDVDGDEATARSYLTVTQRSPDAERLDVITTVCYADAFARTAVGWVWRERRVARRFVGDNSRHRRVADLSTPPRLSLADRMEIRGLVDQYSVSADARDGDAIAELFAPGGRLLIFDQPDVDAAPTEVRDTPTSIAAGPKRLDRYRATSHLVGQHVVSASDLGVSGTTYCVANHLYDGAGNPMNFVVHLRYLDDFVRTDSGWRFAVRRVVFDFVEHRLTGGPIL